MDETYVVGLVSRYHRWLSRQDQWVTRRKGPTWQREFDERMLGRHRRLFGERAFTVINGKLWLAHRLSAEGRHEEALDLYEQVLVQRAERYGADHAKTREARLYLAAELTRLGRHDEARDTLHSLLDTCLRLLGTENDETLRCRLWLSGTLIDLGNLPGAHEQLSEIYWSIQTVGLWWSAEAEQRTKEYWAIVSPEELPD
jgi:tetratricopeptide (TPR) repeat protein